MKTISLGQVVGDFVIVGTKFRRSAILAMCAFCGETHSLSRRDMAGDNIWCRCGARYPLWMRHRVDQWKRKYGEEMAPGSPAALAQEIWLAHGPFERRYHVARIDNTKPYGPDNVYVTATGARYSDVPRPITSSGGNYVPVSQRTAENGMSARQTALAMLKGNA